MWGGLGCGDYVSNLKCGGGFMGHISSSLSGGAGCGDIKVIV